MSHYTVAVMTTRKASKDDLDRIMYPFDEEYRYLPDIDHAADFDELEEEWNKKSKEYPDFENFLLKEYGYNYYNEEERVVGRWFNPHAKWDWWEIGGRWGNLIENNRDNLGNVNFGTYASGEKFRPYAFVDADGHWHEPGPMGWFGISDATDEDMAKYDAEWEEVLKNHGEDWYCTVLDCHI